MELPGVIYRFYERRLRHELKEERIPGHIGVTVDGNRRWAKQMGASTGDGHQAGADKIIEFLGWCREIGVQTVTLYMLSTDNLNRSTDELDQLLDIIANTLDRLSEDPRLNVHAVGALETLPESLRSRLTELSRREKSAKNRPGLHVNVAVGYGGRREIVDAVKELLLDGAKAGKAVEDVASELKVEQISDYLYTRGQPDPDLIIRTSGELRLSGFLLWQSAYSEFYFCEALWPAFRRVDFLRALRDYGNRQRRFGS